MNVKKKRKNPSLRNDMNRHPIAEQARFVSSEKSFSIFLFFFYGKTINFAFIIEYALERSL